MAIPPAFPSKPHSTREDAVAVLRRLRDTGHVAYLAGGCVRDELLGLKPKDYDIATDAAPARVRELFSNTHAVGAAFGVILVRHGRSVVEVATFRTDGKYNDGRRPADVKFTTADEDARRRDFTINGLFLDPIKNEVIDYVGGREDLAARRLRAIGDPNHRFEEDHLRLLRAVRFAARFDLTIDPATSNAIRAHADRLPRISPERIAEELRMMLTPPTRVRAATMLWEFELVNVIFRFLANGATATAPDPSRSIFLSLAPAESVSFGVALATMGLCFSRQLKTPDQDVRTFLSRQSVHELVRALRQALRISNDEADELNDTLLGIAPLLADAPPSVAIKKRFLAEPTATGSRILMDAMARVGLFEDRIAQLRAQVGALSQTEFAPPPFVTGDDLTAAGLTPGPVFKRVLDEVYDAQLEDRIKSKEEALELALRLAGK